MIVYRKISNTVFKNKAPQYLRLLGIAQTCRFQKKSYLHFLLSKQKDVNAFKKMKRIIKNIEYILDVIFSSIVFAFFHNYSGDEEY